MKQENKIALKTMAMKSKLANLIRMEIYPFSDSEYAIKYKGKRKITDKEKLVIFDKIFLAAKEMNIELSNYKQKRQYKTFIQKIREEKKNLALAK